MAFSFREYVSFRVSKTKQKNKYRHHHTFAFIIVKSEFTYNAVFWLFKRDILCVSEYVYTKQRHRYSSKYSYYKYKH